MDNVIAVKPDGTRYWVLDGRRDERPDVILCEQAKDRMSCGEQYAALQAQYPDGHIFGTDGKQLTWRIEEALKLRDPEPHWVTTLCYDGPHGKIVFGPATYAECDEYEEVRKDDVRGDGYFQTERVYFVPQP